MDEILASIRRIIADDESIEQGVSRAADAETPPQPARPVPMPATSGSIPASERWQDRNIGVSGFPETPSRVGEPARSTETARRSPSAPVPVPHTRPMPGEPKPLLAPDAAAAVTDAFDSLGALLVPAQARSVEDLMKEMLRPMLKTWLDENLPRVVEGLVRQEIERVSRRGR